MRLAYLDCFAGISGDMFLGALLAAGVPIEVLETAAAALNLDATLAIETVDRSGISSVKVHVLEASPTAPHTHPHTNPTEEPRNLTTIQTLIQNSTLSPQVKQLATHTFQLLAESEARIHNLPIDQIHFHEVGAVDAILDIVCAAAGIAHLQIDAWHCSPVNVGGGTGVCAHGTFPVPAPATADLLRNIPTYSAHIQKELVTPTGAAILRTLAPTFGPQPPMTVHSIGYGAGTRNPESFPNVLRLSIGTAGSEVGAPHLDSEMWASTNSKEAISIIETNVDDANPQLLAHVAALALAQGALDTTLTPTLMKKGRPGTIVTILCTPQTTGHFTHLLLTELPTLGVRTRTETRTILDRTHRTVQTPYGPIRIKCGSLNGTVLNETPEYEDCRAAATTHNVPLKTVQQAAIAASLTAASLTK